jgi:hypothetical protein
VAGGEFEYAVGLPSQRYYSPWLYLNFTVEGEPFPPVESDLETLRNNVLWTYIQDIPDHERRIRSLQKVARDKMANISEVQERFRKLGLVDQDGDGKGEYGLLAEIAGVALKLRDREGRKAWPTPRPSLPLEGEFGRVNAQGFSLRDDYHYQVFLRGAEGLVSDGGKPPQGEAGNADLQEGPKGWCGYTWPSKRGVSGRAVYFCNEEGKVWESYDFHLEGTENPPRPENTERPKTGTWKLVFKTDRLPRIPFKLKVLRGAIKDMDKMEENLSDIQNLRVHMDHMALQQILSDDQFRQIEEITRALRRARMDFVLDEEEVKAARDGYGRIFRDIYLKTAEITLYEAKQIAEETENAGALAKIEKERKAIQELSQGSPKLKAISDLRKRVIDLKLEVAKGLEKKK